MPGDEIMVPKELREFMPAGAEETMLGNRNGAKRQYRYGNLHIREYEDGFMVHSDVVDPRKDAAGHLIYDAPEVLAGAACALGVLAAGKFRPAGISGIVRPLVAGYLGYAAAKKLKERLEGRHARP